MSHISSNFFILKYDLGYNFSDINKVKSKSGVKLNQKNLHPRVSLNQ